MKQYIVPQTEEIKIKAMSELLLGSAPAPAKSLHVVNATKSITAD